MKWIIDWIRRNGLWIVLIQSSVAMLGSLYYGRYGDPVSNILSGDMSQLFNPNNSLIPCELCRYARILMYPIVFLSIMGLVYRDKRILHYILPISAVWIALEAYHYLLQKVNIPSSYFCTASNPCDALQVNYFWFITIPLLCGIAFTVIFTTIMIMRSHKDKPTDTKKD